MELRINRETLLQPLVYVNSVIERRQTLPILANVYLKIDQGTLWLTGTDLEVEISVSIEGVDADGDWECTIAAQKLLDICRALPENADITLEAGSTTAKITAGKSKFTLQLLPSRDFPRIETQNWQERFTISQDSLRQLIDNTSFSMALQDVRYYLNGLLLEISKDRLIGVATDGHRLSKTETGIDTVAEDQPRQAIVPRKAIVELNRLLATGDTAITVELNNHHIRFTIANINFTSKLVDGEFPDYKSVMATSLPVKINLHRKDFYQTLLRASILTNDKFRGVRIRLSDQLLTVTSNNPEQEQATDELIIEGYHGPDLEIGFNVSYLMDILKVLDCDEVEFSVKDSNSSCTLNQPATTQTKYLVMPMRL